jgi:hypothetical protein
LRDGRSDVRPDGLTGPCALSGRGPVGTLHVRTVPGARQSGGVTQIGEDQAISPSTWKTRA